jgi:hypothetical protein
MVRRTLIGGLAVLAVLAAATPADAQPSIKKAIWGPVERDGVDQFPIYADLGVGLWQTAVRWDEVAPTRPAAPRNPADPAYRWPVDVDRAINEGAKYGIGVSVLLIGAPSWANGGKDWRHAPKRVRRWADFAEAAARRWPAVHHWMIWGEPTKRENFQPLVADHGRPLRTARQLRGPRLYARMLDASYGRLKGVSRANKVIGGNTYTVGTVAPLRFMRALRLPNGRPPRMDMWGHNPFTLRKPDLDQRPLGSGFADFSDLDTLARALDRSMRRARLRRQRRLPLFISELSLPTDHPNYEFNFYVDRPTQADWIKRMLRISRGWSRIYTFGYLGLYDDAPRPNGDQVERGLLQFDGTQKPAYAAFRDG